MNDATASSCLLAIDPGLGAAVGGPPGPVRDAFLASVRSGLPRAAPLRRMPATISDDRLLGGLDLAATLASGKRIAEAGLLAQADGGVVVVVMAERLPLDVAARLTGAMDTGTVRAERDGMSQLHPARFGVIALDEGGEQAPPAGLLDRLAFRLTPDAPIAELLDPAAIGEARRFLASVEPGEQSAPALVAACAGLGIASLRAPLLALRAACAAAAYAGRAKIAEQDLQLAARLVLAPRATSLPDEQPTDPPAEQPEPDPESDDSEPGEAGRLADTVLEAARCALPSDILAGLAGGAAQRARAGGTAGALRRDAKRGRIVGSKPGDLRGGARLDLLGTLRAAAPWQRLRAGSGGTGIAIRKADFRIRRFHQPSRTTTIFVVDASGSAAVARLAEAKGAVESLLAVCYVRRDRVALMAVRGRGADILLPPTPSLARAKRLLAGMPGGGGTPLAAGFAACLVLAAGVRRAGQTPVAVFMTDGRPNIALNGTPGRAGAEADALVAARAWRAAGHASLLVDMAARPHPFARVLADAAGATYIVLPRTDPAALQGAVRAIAPR